MADADPGVQEFQTSAAMWAYAVGIYHEQLREAVEAYAQARHDGAIRNSILRAPEHAQRLMAGQLERATAVMTISTPWRMSLARYCFLSVAAQLRKCTVALEERDVVVPQLRARKILRLLRDVDEHWEQVVEGRSLAELRELLPDEVPTLVKYNGNYIQLGDFDTREIVEWAAEVETVVRGQLDQTGNPLPDVRQPLSEFFAKHPAEDE